MKSISAIKREVFDFLSIEPGMNIAIVSDNDEDGLTAAVQAKLFIDMSGANAKVFFYDHNMKQARFFDEFNKIQFDRTLFLDLNESFISDVLESVCENVGKFLIIDHHETLPLNFVKTEYFSIKPWDFSKVTPSHYPASKMVYDIFGGIDWVCAIGVIGDYAFKEWSTFIKQVLKNHSLTEVELHELAGIVGCISAFHSRKITDLFDYLCSAKSPRDLFNSWFSDLKKDFDEALALEKKRFYTEAMFVEDANVYFFETKPNFRSKLSNLISKELPSSTIVIFEDQGVNFGASFRRSDFKVDCGKLASFAVKEAKNGRGGGHIPAAAATFPRTYLTRLKEKILVHLRENYPTKIPRSKSNKGELITKQNLKIKNKKRK
ncbi:MAG TPA: hypothetical protein PKK60_02155 [archaeon]|nr:hypothetical protein [archaeon]